MPARLILNADDFGLTRGINRAVGELAAGRVLTSATLMAGGSAFDDAVEVAQAHPGLGVGCHVVLVDGTPLSHPHSIPSLVGPDGKTFRSSLSDFLLAVLRGRISEDDIAREALAQIQRLQRAGIDVTHVDTHKHTHMLPGVARPLLYAAERCGVGAVRNPFEPAWSLSLGGADPMRRLQVTLLRRLEARFRALPQLHSGRIHTTDGTAGIAATGRIDTAWLRTARIVAPPGVWEVVLHPGYNDASLGRVATRLRATRDIERSALLSAFTEFDEPAEDSLQPSPPELIHYGSLGGAGVLRALGQFTPHTGHEHVL